jgi:HSP20 family molecular chaperone IbpA
MAATIDNYDRNLDTQKHLERTQKKQDELVQKSEMELEASKEFYRGRQDQGDRLQNLRLEKDLEIIQESDRKTQKLDELRKSIDETQKSVAIEKENILINNHEKLADIKKVQDGNIQDKMREARDLSRDLKNKSQLNIQAVEGKSRLEIGNQSKVANKKIINNQNVYDHKIENMVKNQESTLSDSEFVHARTMATMEMEQLKKKQHVDYKHKYEINEVQKNNEKDFIALNKKHEEEMKQSQKAFEEKYKNMVENHQDVLNLVQSRLENELNSTISSHARFRATKEDKITDPFYQVSKVDAQVEDLEKEYIVRIPIPEYERENVHLTAKERELNIAISRRFGEDVKAATGDIYRSKKSENFSRIIPVKEIVDSSKITQAYENGILSFKIAKK